MSAPRLRRRNYGRGHGYQIDGQKVMGVTTVLNSLPKDALINWAARVTAEAAVDRWDELGKMPPSQRLKELTDARWNVTQEAALRGTEIHDLGERVSKGEAVDAGEHQGAVEGYARFLDEWGVDVLGTEAPCGSTQFMYAGTLDSIAVIEKISPDPVMLDIKTGKGVYESAALQLEAYARCDVWQPDGPDSEEPMPEVHGLYIAHIGADATRLVPVIENRDALFAQFRYLHQTALWLAAAKDQPPLGAALNVEEYA